DYQGNLWFTSSRLGLLRLATSSFLNIYSTIGMAHHVVNSVVFWQNHYYIGTDKGLDIIDENMAEQIKNSLTRELSGIRIRCLLVDSKNSLWICTYGNGLIEIEENGTRHVYSSTDALFGNRVRAAFELSDGTILVGSDKGISFIREHKVDEKLTASMESIHSMILTATELPDGRVVVGTDGGGLVVIEDYKVAGILTREDGLNSEVILRTVYDEKGKGLFIINSNGICYMESDGSIRSLKNFPYYNNYDIFIENGSDRLFVMSSAGIFVAKREDVLADQPDLQYELLDSRRGLDSSLTVNSWYYSNEAGELFLPCDSGVYMINTHTYANSAQIFRMSLASILLDGEETYADRDNTITVPRSVIRLDIIPEIINYSVQVPYVGYYLEGLEPDWQIMPLDALKTANYPNLPVGKYTFHLAVFDANQQEILIQRNYPVIKEKEIYDNSWFLIYMVTIPVLVAIWLTTYISMKRNERIMERQAAALALSQQQVKMSNDTIIAIARAVDAKDERTSQHSWRVSEYSVMIGREMGLGEEDIENLRRAALVHDIGKIGIADAILNKDSRLTDEEYAIMKSHTVRGADILKGLTYIPHVLDGALYHHERIDGRGYPNGLKGEEIPLFARIIGVADAFDAMTANRVYRKQMDLGYVLGEMERGRGTQFDPEADDILIRLLNDGTIDLKKLYPSLGTTPEVKKDEGGAA
ncbi:MAG: HD domain-containing protein, partial [Anaerolineaceae bacterium]|nr:HD domain-containing protein [Anaerolineaceae bacterium]